MLHCNGHVIFIYRILFDLREKENSASNALRGQGLRMYFHLFTLLKKYFAR